MAETALVLSSRSVWCQGNHVNANASDATLVITFDSQTHVIQVHKYCTKCETLQFAMPAWNLFTQGNESRVWSRLSARQVFGKIQLLAKSRNRRLSSEQKLQQALNSRGNLSCFIIFYCISMVFGHWPWIEYSIEFKISCSHDCKHALLCLVSRITVSPANTAVSSLLTICRLIVSISKQKWIKSLN